MFLAGLRRSHRRRGCALQPWQMYRCITGHFDSMADELESFLITCGSGQADSLQPNPHSTGPQPEVGETALAARYSQVPPEVVCQNAQQLAAVLKADWAAIVQQIGHPLASRPARQSAGGARGKRQRGGAGDADQVSALPLASRSRSGRAVKAPSYHSAYATGADINAAVRESDARGLVVQGDTAAAAAAAAVGAVRAAPSKRRKGAAGAAAFALTMGLVMLAGGAWPGTSQPVQDAALPPFGGAGAGAGAGAGGGGGGGG